MDVVYHTTVNLSPLSCKGNDANKALACMLQILFACLWINRMLLGTMASQHVFWDFFFLEPLLLLLVTLVDTLKKHRNRPT